MLTVLHTEASTGWGGQEMRIFKESMAMRERGIRILLAADPRSQLLKRMREAGFTTYAIPFERRYALWTLLRLLFIRADIVNTHSSWDSWIGGLAARLTGRKIVRTRHLSTSIRPGLNSRILYKWLADAVVTTCEEAAAMVRKQSGQSDVVSIPTGVKPFTVTGHFPCPGFVVGTCCVLRGWKGIWMIVEAARMAPEITWLIVGDGPMRPQLARLPNIIYTGHLESPFAAMEAMHVFTLMSVANEGVSQAQLQAAWLKKPLLTTATGGLKEVTLNGKTGYIVSNAEELVARARELMANPTLCKEMGEAAHALVRKQFTLEHTIERMINTYERIGMDAVCGRLRSDV